MESHCSKKTCPHKTHVTDIWNRSYLVKCPCDKIFTCDKKSWMCEETFHCFLVSHPLKNSDSHGSSPYPIKTNMNHKGIRELFNISIYTMDLVEKIISDNLRSQLVRKLLISPLVNFWTCLNDTWRLGWVVLTKRSTPLSIFWATSVTVHRNDQKYAG